MRILYGLSSDGLGHTMRARVVAQHLRALGHELRLATSGRAAQILRAHGLPVVEARSIQARYAGGRVLRSGTLLRIVREAPARLEHNFHAAVAQVRSFRPDLVLTDFSGFACVVAHLAGCPAISIDHQHIVDRFLHPAALLRDFARDFALAQAAVRLKTPGCDHYVVTSFFAPAPNPKVADSTTLIGPLLRPELARYEARRGQHLVVYQTAGDAGALLSVLRAVASVPFHVYGTKALGRFGNVEFRAFDESGFLADLASARAVITNGGFTAIAEALHFGKPVLGIPLLHQGEQQLNAAWLAALGLGMTAPALEVGVVREFVDCLPELGALNHPRPSDGTERGLEILSRVLAEVA